jgi:hypothetical protein
MVSTSVAQKDCLLAE